MFVICITSSLARFSYLHIGEDNATHYAGRENLLPVVFKCKAKANKTCAKLKEMGRLHPNWHVAPVDDSFRKEHHKFIEL